MTLYERLQRLDNEDIVILGEIIEKGQRSEFGRLTELLIVNLKTLELQNSRAGTQNSDKVLGRLEAYETLLSDLSSFVSQKQALQRPLSPDLEETSGATEQTTPIRAGGEI